MSIVWHLLGSDWILLGGAAFFAGMVDAVVGGGGLITVPVLLGVFPNAAIPTLFGTNKVSAIAGTSSAIWRYGRSVAMPWRVVWPAAVAALVGAWIGAALVVWLPRNWMQPLILVLMICAAVYTFLNKELGRTHDLEQGGGAGAPKGKRWGGAFGLTLGFYDGFFGPGAGSLMILGFVRLFRMDFLRASACAKVVNFATNAAAITFFVSSTALMWRTGVVMAGCNILGAQLGTALALRHGSGFIRKLFLLSVVVLIGKLAFDTARGWLPSLL